MESTQAPRTFKPRRPHKKSRNGCQYCRRRRIKCDETRPQCNRCASRNQPCEYLTNPTSPRDKSPTSSPTFHPGSTDNSNDHTTIETLDSGYEASPSLVSSFEHTPLHGSTTPPMDFLMGFEQQLSPLLNFAQNDAFDDTRAYSKDLYLLDYYLGPLSLSWISIPHVNYAMRIGVPNLAAHHRGLLSSILAIGAAGLCIDILTNRVPTGISSQDIVELLRVGDRYHQQGIESVRDDIVSIEHSDSKMSQLQAVMLFPYTLARRRILRLLNGPDHQSTPYCSNIPLDLSEDSPAKFEWMVCLRGVTTMGLVYKADQELANDRSVGWYLKEHQTLDPTVSAQVLEKLSQHTKKDMSIRSNLRQVGSRHPLFPMLSSTRVSALENLQQKVDNLQRRVRKLQRKGISEMSFEITTTQQAYSASLAACTLAIDTLAGTADCLFDESPEPGQVTLPQDLDASWLETLCSPPSRHSPDSPLARIVLAWINRVPNEYMSLLLKPLPRAGYDHQDQLIQVQFREIDLETQLLAWDIYAHWLVFAILIEHESWYVADLGTFDIKKTREILLRYSRVGNSEIAASAESEKDYWPSAMSSIAQQLQKYQNQVPGGGSRETSQWL